jgi:UPF0755 protein
MSRRTARNKPPLTAFRIVVLMFLAGTALALAAAAGMWLFSDETSGLPRPARDLPAANQLYLRVYLRLHEGELNSAAAPMDGLFMVREGDTALAVSQRLSLEGWVQSADLVANYLAYTGGDRSIGSGMYLLRAGQSPRQIADSLASGAGKVRSLTVFAGWRMEEIAQALPASGIPISPSDFLVAASGRPGAGSDLESLYAEIPSGATLEGFLLPGTYNVPPGESADGLVQRMLRSFRQAVPADWIAAYAGRGLTFDQAVTLAAIIQREAKLEDEMPLIASVFFNRLRQNMPLQTDPTVQYAVGFQPDRNGWWANPLLESDLSLDSPYNTYLYPGLPPGPICNPDIAALQAVAFPADSPYLFFRAACDGSGRHNFAETILQHRANACGE